MFNAYNEEYAYMYYFLYFMMNQFSGFTQLVSHVIIDNSDSKRLNSKTARQICAACRAACRVPRRAAYMCVPLFGVYFPQKKDPFSPTAIFVKYEGGGGGNGKKKRIYFYGPSKSLLRL